jgi:hypothetical protein
MEPTERKSFLSLFIFLQKVYLNVGGGTELYKAKLQFFPAQH